MVVAHTLYIDEIGKLINLKDESVIIVIDSDCGVRKTLYSHATVGFPVEPEAMTAAMVRRRKKERREKGRDKTYYFLKNKNSPIIR